MQYSFRPHLHSKDDAVFEAIYKEAGIVGKGSHPKWRLFCNRLLTNLFKTGADTLIILLSQKHYDPGTLYSQHKSKGVTYRTAMQVIKKLFKAGFIDVFPGDNSKEHGKSYSNIRPRKKLRLAFAAIKELKFLHEVVPVQIKSEDENEKEIYLPLPHNNPYLEEVTQTMDRYNKAIKNVEISYHPSECIDMFYPEHPNLDNRYLTASYKNSLDEGGRMFKGFFVNMPKKQRAYLKMDRESLVQFDFDHFFIALLYKKIGKPVPDNPYLFGKDPKRKVAKKLMQILLNGKGSQRSEKQRLNDIILAYRDEKAKNPFVPREELTFIIEQLKEKHYLIKDFFNSNIWGDLQKQESDIMRSIMDQCLDLDIVILPIHDGLLCKGSDKQELEEIFDNTGFDYSVDPLKEQIPEMEENLLINYLVTMKLNMLIIYKVISYNSSVLSSLKGYTLFKCSDNPWKRAVSIPDSLTPQEEEMFSSGSFSWVVDRKEQKAILVMKGDCHQYYSVSEYAELITLPQGEQPKELKHYFWH